MTAAKKTETNEGEMEPVPEVGLGAGDSAAMAEPIRAQTATRTRIREAFERPIAQSRRRRSAADDGAKTIERSQGHRHLLYRLT